MSETTYFRDVTINPCNDGDALVVWETPEGEVDTLLLTASDYGTAGGALAAATELAEALDAIGSPLLAPLPEGVEWVMRAPASVVRELGWEWWDGPVWQASVPHYYRADAVLVCRPPLPPQVTVGDTTLPADATDEDIVAAFRAAGGAS